MKKIVTEIEETHVEVENANDLVRNITNYVMEIPVGDIVTIEQKDISRIHLKEDRIHIWFMDGSHANFKVKLK